jgi:hypothetical protein
MLILMEPASLLEMLRAIEKRPALYIGDHDQHRFTIWHLHSFYVGFQTGRHGAGEPDMTLDALTFWVCLRYKETMGAADWSTLLLRQSNNDAEAAFRLFFELFEQYIADRERLGYEGLKASYLAMAETLRDEP